MDLTNEQWEILEPLISDPARRADGCSRPWRDSRDVLNGILWVLRTGAPWRDLPERYPPYQTCHRRFQQWNEEGVVDEILRALAEDLKEQGGSPEGQAGGDGRVARALGSHQGAPLAVTTRAGVFPRLAGLLLIAGDVVFGPGSFTGPALACAALVWLGSALLSAWRSAGLQVRDTGAGV